MVTIHKRKPSTLTEQRIIGSKKNHDSISDDEILDTLKPIDYFGELSIIENLPRSAGAKTDTACKLLRLSKDDFINVCQKYPPAMIEIFRKNCMKLKKADERYINAIDKSYLEKGLIDIGKAVGKIVHDISTPISIIMLQSELITSNFPDALKYTDKIKKRANDIDELAKEILDFTSGKRSIYNMTECLPIELLNNVEEIMSPVASIKNIRIHFENSINSKVMIDYSKMTRTLTNLIKNAIEACDENTTVNVISTEINNQWKIVVRDNGPGLPEDLIDKIFQPFVTKGKASGTGLGLAICKKCIEDHKGSIEVINHPAGGVEFTIIMPI